MDDRTILMSAKPLQNGYELDSYKILDVLGKGGFGITYRALDTKLDREVAIKEFLPSSFAFRHQDYSVRPMSAGDASDNFAWGLRSFLKEAKTLAKFSHRNIVRVHTVFERHNTAYMVMEYEHGESLASIYSQNQSVTMPLLESIFFPIFDGLKDIHNIDFIHRDIKPSNIYIRQDGSPVLIDFGSARQSVQDETSELTSLVSQGYTPLEQYSADYGRQGPWTDIYALAATIYQGVSGIKPLDAVSRSACLFRSQPDRLQALVVDEYPDFDQRFLDAVHHGLLLQPENRPQSLQDWATEFGVPVQNNPNLYTPTIKAGEAITDYSPSHLSVTESYSRNTDSMAETTINPAQREPLATRTDANTTATPILSGDNQLSSQSGNSKKWLVIGGISLIILAIAGGLALLIPDIKATLDPNQSVPDTAQKTQTTDTAQNTQSQKLAVAEVVEQQSVEQQAVVEVQPVEAAPALIPVSEDALFAQATFSQQAKDYRIYLDAFPSGKYAELARAEVANLVPTPSPDTVAVEVIEDTQLKPFITSAIGEAVPVEPSALIGVSPNNPIQFSSTLFEYPNSGEQYTLQQLIEISPNFSPIEGLDESAWKAAQCSDCHSWDKTTLCEQGNRYVDGADEMITRIQHPHGGFFKSALKQWAGTQCQ